MLSSFVSSLRRNGRLQDRTETASAPIDADTQERQRPMAPSIGDRGLGQRALFSHVYSAAGPTSADQAGITAGTQLETIDGPKPVEDIRAGDLVRTFDNGFQEVQSIQRESGRSRLNTNGSSSRLVWVDAGALDNEAPLVLPPDQPILIESDLAEMAFGDPFAVVTADSLVGEAFACFVSNCEVFDIYRIKFSQPQLAYCAGGALVWFDGAETARDVASPTCSYRIFTDRVGRALAGFRAIGSQPDNGIRNGFFAEDSGAVSVDFVILTAAAAGLGAVALSIVGSGAVEMSGKIESFLANIQIGAM
jgi:hypothetical protein